MNIIIIIISCHIILYTSWCRHRCIKKITSAVAAATVEAAAAAAVESFRFLA